LSEYDEVAQMKAVHSALVTELKEKPLRDFWRGRQPARKRIENGGERMEKGGERMGKGGERTGKGKERKGERMTGKGFSAGILIAGMLAGASLAPARLWACYAVVVGKDASADGSVLFGHNEQDWGKRYLNFRKVPRIARRKGETVTLSGGAEIAQVKETYAYLWSEVPGLPYSDSYLNEWGVAVASDGCADREDSAEQLEARGDLTKGGVSYLLRRLVIERARTAREGVEVAGEIIGEVGYPAARTLVIADPNEAWLLAMAKGKRWVAQRVADDEVALLPNSYTIGEVDLKDTDNFLAAPDLIEYAVRRGWHNPASGKPFRFWEAYGAPREQCMDPRQRRGQTLVTGKEIAGEPDRQLPFSVKPARKMSIQDVMGVLRDHGVPGGLCAPETVEAAVFQLRRNLPPDVGCVYWRTSAAPCASVLTPWYAGVTEVPAEYHKPIPLERHLTLESHFLDDPALYEPDEKLAWWVFRNLQETVGRDRESRLPIVRAAWDKMERELLKAQPEIEKKALEIFQKDEAAARAHLTKYCQEAAREALQMARSLKKQWESD